MSPKPVALHQKIRLDIAGRIRAGALKPGDKIPYEYELTQTYGCARMTVNKALSALAGEGLIERRKKAGSFVKPQRLDSTILTIPDIESEVTGRGEAYRFQLLSAESGAAVSDEEKALSGAGAVLRLKGVHICAGRPLAVEARLINLGAVPSAIMVDFNRQSPGHWLLQAVPWTRAESQISAQAADSATAKLLEREKGAACLVVSRRTWREGEPITSVRQVFDGDSYRLVAAFDH